MEGHRKSIHSGCDLDVIYQIIVFRKRYVLETLIVAAGLAIVTYILFRGPINRVIGLFD
jgi:hypothetical protein